MVHMYTQRMCTYIQKVVFLVQTPNRLLLFSTLQYSCLGNPTDRRAYWATVQGVVKSWTWWETVCAWKVGPHKNENITNKSRRWKAKRQEEDCSLMKEKLFLLFLSLSRHHLPAPGLFTHLGALQSFPLAIFFFFFFFFGGFGRPWWLRW